LKGPLSIENALVSLSNDADVEDTPTSPGHLGREVSGFDDMVEQHGRLKRRRFDFDRGWIESWVEFEYDASDHVRAFFCLDKDSPFMPGYAGSG